MFWRNKKVLVTGGAGVIGCPLINELINRAANVLCVDRESKPMEMSEKVQYCQADISQMDMNSVIDFDPEVIFHLAASFERTDETPEFWNINFRDNVLVSHRIIEAARTLRNLQKFVFASSYLIYSSALYLYDKPQEKSYSLKEGDILETRNLTGAAKYYTEKELEFMNTTQGEFITILARIFRVYGCGSRDVISRWVRMALNKEELVVFKKQNRFDYIYAGDVALGLIKSAENINHNEIVNLGSGRAYKIEDVLQTIKRLIPSLRIREINEGVFFESSCSDMTKFIKLTHWQPNTTLDEGIKRIVNYENQILHNELCIKG